MNGPDLQKKHARYIAQTQWTESLRKVLYSKLPRINSLSILEVGSGTGAVLRCIQAEIPERIRILIGIDIDPVSVSFSSRNNSAENIIADGRFLPFADESFDFVYCHYSLLWCGSPKTIITEMRRVTASKGICAALAEPCYSEMDASPESLYRAGCSQREMLKRKGADADIGNRLGCLFYNAGFTRFEFEKYGKTKMTDEYLRGEILQLSEDIGADPSVICPGGKSYYYVPAYYAFAVK